MKQPINPNAFPSEIRGKDNATNEEIRIYQSGMTLRDYFAAKAMQSLINGAYPRDYHWGNDQKDEKPAMAERAYKIADAMLKQREL